MWPNAGSLRSGNDFLHSQLTFTDAFRSQTQLGSGHIGYSQEFTAQNTAGQMGVTAVCSPWAQLTPLIWGLSGGGLMSWSGRIACRHASDCEGPSGWRAMCKGPEDLGSGGSVRFC